MSAQLREIKDEKKKQKRRTSNIFFFFFRKSFFFFSLVEQVVAAFFRLRSNLADSWQSWRSDLSERSALSSP